MPYTKHRHATSCLIGFLGLFSSSVLWAADIHVNIDNFQGSGIVHAALMAVPAEDWNAEPVQIAQGKPPLHFKEIAPGNYAIQLFVDLDGDAKLATSKRGIPREPVGFSNNPTLFTGMPTPQRAAFVHDKNGTELTIHLRVRPKRQASTPAAD